VVKAPIEWAGTVGNCPKCGKSIVMPGVAPDIAQRIRNEADAREMAAGKPPTRKTGAGLSASKTGAPPASPTRRQEASDDSGVMDSILNEENTATLAVEGVDAKEWEKRKMARAAQMVKQKEGFVGSIMFNLKHNVLGK
jgi:hypothetical protein